MLFFQLLKTDLLLFRQNITDKFINLVIWAGSTAIVSGYVLQAFGINESFGAFQMASIIISSIGFEVYGQLFTMVADFEGSRHINYHLTLPASNKVILLAKTTFFAINGMILSVSMLPLAKLLLWSKLDLWSINYPQFFLTLVITNIFFAWFTLFLVSLVKNVGKIEDVIMRVMFPLWFFGCFQFSFKVANTISPILAGICLVSPYTFATEAIRYAMLNPADYLPFWLSITGLCAMSVFVCLAGYWKLKRRLDFI